MYDICEEYIKSLVSCSVVSSPTRPTGCFESVGLLKFLNWARSSGPSLRNIPRKKKLER